MEIVKYIINKNIDIRFEDGTIVNNKPYSCFIRGTIKNPNYGYKEKYVGIENVNKDGLHMKIIEYRTNSDIDVQFENGEILKNKSIQKFLNGSIKCPSTILKIHNIGMYDGDKNEKKERIYRAWSNMLYRCYKNKYIAYNDCKVDEKWHTYSNFKKWFKENTWNDDIKLIPDKDILTHGKEKVYSESTCLLVDQRINNLFVNHRLNRGIYPLGVNKHEDKFEAAYMKNKKRIYLGLFDTPEDAFYAYKYAKENYFKEVAD